MYILYQEVNEKHKTRFPPVFHCVLRIPFHYLKITKDLPITDQLIISSTRNGIRQSPYAELAGSAKSCSGKQELILKSIFHTQQDEPPQVMQKLRVYH